MFVLIVQLEKKALEVLQKTYLEFDITLNQVPVMPDSLDIYLGKWKSTIWKNGFFREFGVKDGIKRSLDFEDQYNSELILKRTIFRCYPRHSYNAISSFSNTEALFCLLFALQSFLTPLYVIVDTFILSSSL